MPAHLHDPIRDGRPGCGREIGSIRKQRGLAGLSISASALYARVKVASEEWALRTDVLGVGGSILSGVLVVVTFLFARDEMRAGRAAG